MGLSRLSGIKKREFQNVCSAFSAQLAPANGIAVCLKTNYIGTPSLKQSFLKNYIKYEYNRTYYNII